MATLNVYGMGTPMVVHRPLNDQERAHRFDINKPTGGKPHYDLSLVKLNSTFVECVDKWYAARGAIAMGSGLFSVLILCYVVFGFYVSYIDSDWLFFLMTLVPLGMFGFTLKMFISDAFTYTHYPIRFNRKNRQVYVFRRDGTVLKVGWEDIYWTIYGHKIAMNDIFVIGHVMAPDGITVNESFGLSTVDIGKAGENNLKSLFEFFRLYMQEGPERVLEAIKPTPLIMLPGIDRERESWRFGWETLTLSLNGMVVFQILLQVFFLPMSLFRWIVMRTSKIPQWPQWVEDECAIESDDVWVRQ